MTKRRAERLAHRIHEGARGNAALHNAAHASDADAVLELLQQEQHEARVCVRARLCVCVCVCVCAA